MSHEEPLEERQENEVAAIKAIFDSAVVDVREQDAWKVHRPPELQIRLLPQESMDRKEAHVEVTLVIKCGPRYPFEPPSVELIDPKGLPETAVKKFTRELELQAERIKGQEMMYSLAETVQVFLYANNNPASKSFYEQMMLKQRTESERLAAEETMRRESFERQRELELQQIELEVEKRKTYMQREERNVRDPKEENPEKMGSGDNLSTSPSSVDAPRNAHGHTRSRSTEDAEFRNKSLLRDCKEPFVIELKSGRKKRLQLIKSHGLGSRGCFVHYALDLERDGMMVVVSEWLFRWRPTRRKPSTQQVEMFREESLKYIQQLDLIDAELQCTSKLRSPGLVHYIGWRYGFEKDHVFAHVLKDYVQGLPVSTFLVDHAAFSVEQIRLLAVQLLETLGYLHRNDIVHRHIKPQSVFCSITGKFLLADHCIEKKLEDVYQYSLRETGEMVVSNKGGKKSDILQYGILLVSLLVGDFLMEESHDLPLSIPADAKNFLGHCLSQLDKDRWSFDQLLAHRFITTRSAVTEKAVPAPSEAEKGFYKKFRGDLPDEENSDVAVQPATRSLAVSSESRLHRDFEIVQFCGKGGFGDVLKVRNVLDGRTYAIKRIPLQETGEKLNKRILREVQLLSRLNHENVVRYYNSWIESVASGADSTRESSFATLDTPSKANGKAAMVKPPDGFINSLGFLPDDIEKNAPPAAEDSVEWSVGGDFEDESDSSGDENSQTGDQGFFGPLYPKKMHVSSDTSSEEILFGTDGVARDETSSEEDTPVTQPAAPVPQTGASSIKSPLPSVVLFLQMEYCDKSTLRTCIEEGLYLDQVRAWRLLREIVEGLAHIHQQGIIHRDLKPVNIFIDSEDHVRIGDFGLATHTVMSRSTFADNLSDLNSFHHPDTGTDDVSRTGRIGTALYVAPELLDNAAKVSYSQKVDMYSLGVSFFEMCYRPLPTGMERTKVLQNVRKSPVQFPSDFDSIAYQRQILLLVSLLDHDPRKRPHAVELLQSDLLPPPKIEEAEVNEIIRHTVQNPQSKVYKQLMQSLFDQKMDAVTDLTYDLDVQKGYASKKSVWAFEVVEQKVAEVFQLHGAVRLQTPLLAPKSELYGARDNVVTLLDTTGDVVTIPHDLRVPFARYVARNGVSSMKRFCIDRVFRSRKINAAHPRELWECAFDVITSFPESLLPDAECISVVSDIINEFPSLSNCVFHLRVNHTDFLRATFLHAGVPEAKMEAALDWLWTLRCENVSKVHARQRLLAISEISDHSYKFLEKFLETEGVLSQISELVKTIAKRKGPAGSLAKRALLDCETFVGLLEKMGCPFRVDFCLGITDRYMRSGLVFHIVRSDENRSKSSRPEIFAAGGRYSSLVQDFRRQQSAKEADLRPAAVGMSMAFDKLVGAVGESDELSRQSAIDVLICSSGSSSMLKEQIGVLRDLRKNGIRADILMDPHPVLEDTQDFCRKMGIHLIILKDSSCTVRFMERDRVSERKLGLNELAEWITQKTNSAKVDQTDLPSLSNENIAPAHHVLPGNRVKITFITAERLPARDRKRHSTHLLTVLESTIASFAAHTQLEILVLELPGSVLKWLPVYMSRAVDGNIICDDWSQLCDKFPKYRKYLKQVHDDLLDVSFDTKVRLLLYSLVDDKYRPLV